MSAAGRIHVLEPALINKIAAGEVVERPASVVKELIDNAIDSGATRIAVTVEDGGRKLIRVTDDGCGMTPAELPLAVRPHATSKITSDADLYAIQSMGFRGEALASISSVSKLRLASRVTGADEGHEIRFEGERVESSQAVGCPPGTTVEVRELFFNVPARRRFLRAKSTETGHINEQFTRAALAWPGLGFELTGNGRRSHNLPAGQDRLQRIAKFYGDELASALIHVARNEQGIGIEAYIAPPARSRATATWQYTFVNGRYIRDRYVQHAIKEAHRGLMEPNRHGVVFLFLSIEPDRLDVNVHPTKIEVRWADSNLIHSQVLSALRETFQGHDLTPSLRAPQQASPATPAPNPQEQERMRRELASLLKSATPREAGDEAGPRPEADRGLSRFDTGQIDAGRFGAGQVGAGQSETGYRGAGSHASPPPRRDTAPDPIESWRSLYAPPRDGAAAEPPAALPYDVGAAVTGDSGQLRAVQMHNLYLVAETEEGIVIVDQHALHERVMYEEFREKLTHGPLESQRLLLPETIAVTASQAALLTEHAELLARLGIEVTPFGRDEVAVQSFPALLSDVDVRAFMRDLLDRLADQPHATTEQIIHEALDMMACKAAVKAGDPLSAGEIEALMQKRHLIEKPSNCPHGRPTMLRLSKADLSRQFKRT